MKWFYDLPIKMKLLSSFILMALIAGAVGVIGTQNINKINNAGTILYEQNTVPISKLAQIDVLIQRVRINLRDMTIANNPEDIARYQTNVISLSSDRDKLIDEYAKYATSDKEKELLDSFVKSHDQFSLYESRIADLARQNKDAQATEVIQKIAKPVALSMQKDMDNLVAYKLESAKSTAEKNGELAASATKSMILLIVIAAVLALGFGMFITKIIAGPINMLASVVDKLAAGDMDVSVDLETKDELGKLGRSFGNIITTIKALVFESGKMVQWVKDGNIEKRADVAGFHGEYKQLLVGMNDMVDAVQLPLNETLNVCARLSLNDLDARISGEYSGIWQETKNAVNLFADRVTHVKDIVLDLSNGDIHELNDLKAVGKRGDYDQLVPAFIKLMEALQALIVDAEMLTKAATEERFAVRADASKHRGEFANVVNGVNATLDVVVDKIYWFEALLDSVPMPLSVTDNDLKWTFINKAVENQIGLKRAEVVGKHCSKWNSNICNTEKCGIARLRNNIQQTIFDQEGMHFQVNSSYINNAKGEKIGHIEVVQDITAAQKVSVYQNIEVDRLATVLDRLANGDLTFDIEVAEADKYTQETRESFFRISTSLLQARDALADMIHQASAASSRVLASAREVASTSQEIGNSSHSIAETIGQVAAGSTEQSKTTIAVSTSMEQLSKAILEVANGAQDQVKTVEETVALIQQITDVINSVADTAQDAAKSSLKVSEVAKTGGESVGKSVKGMMRIKETTANVVDAITELGEHSRQIGAIVETIDDIAEQTNLLALNAAIEAARAGEHGKGFAVVADEVRKLAERSSKATKEIAALINSIRQMTDNAVAATKGGAAEIEAGAELATQAGDALISIQESVNDIVRQIEDMSAATEQMSASSTEVVRAVESLSAITEQSSAAAEEMTASSSEVTRAIEQVAAVSEESAASAEEVSAAAEEQNASVEEMSASAQELETTAEGLQAVVSRFRVNEDNGVSSESVRSVSKHTLRPSSYSRS